MKNVDFSGADGGERALLANDSDHLSLSDSSATGFLSTVGAILEFNTCNNVDIRDVNVTKNTKSAVLDNIYFDASTAFVFFGAPGFVDDGYLGCDNVTLTRVKVNDNTINNYNAPAFWQTFEAIFFGWSRNGVLLDCETSGNVDILGSDGPSEDTEDMFLALSFCENFTITNHKSNNNQCLQRIFWLLCYAAMDSVGCTLNSCQANGSYVAELDTRIPGLAILTGYWMLGYFFLTISGQTLSKCEAVANVVASGGAGRTSWTRGAFLEAFIVTACILTDCISNDNTILQTLPFSSVLGFVPDRDCILTGCIARRNTGGEIAVGIQPNNGAIIRNCISEFNQNFGIQFAFPGFPVSSLRVTRGLISSCVVQNNGLNLASGNVGGIYIDTTSSKKNIVIEKTNIVNNGSFSANSYGILVGSAGMDGLVVSDCEIIQATVPVAVVINTETPQYFPAVYTLNGPKVSIAPALTMVAGSIAQPTNACNAPLDPALSGKIGIIFIASSPCGSADWTNNTQAAGAVAGIIIAPGTNVNALGNATLPTVVLTAVEGALFQTALAAAPPGTTVSLEKDAPGAFSTGIYMPNVTNSKVIRTEVFNARNGIEVAGTSSNVSLIENVCTNTGKGFVLSATTTNSLVQDNRAIGNAVAGFEQDASTSAFSTTYIGNQAQNTVATTSAQNFAGASLISKINLQELHLSDGSLTVVNSLAGAAAPGARFTNVSTVA